MTKQQLFKLLKRRIEVSRFEAHVRRDLLQRLNKLHRQVKGQIGGVDVDNIGKRELNRLLKDIDELSSETHTELAVLMTGYSLDLIDDEADFVRREMDWQTPKKTPDFVPVVLGATINEWLSKQTRDYTHSVKMAVRTGRTLDYLPKWLGNQTKAFTVTWANATSQQTQRKLAEKSKGFSEYQHNSLLDSKTSDMCIVRHLKRWTADKEPIGHDLKYEEPPLHRHCRSFMTFDFDFYDSSEIDGVTADEWLDSMSNKEQAEVLGVGKAAMYRRGDITLRDLLDQSGRPKPLYRLKAEKGYTDVRKGLDRVAKVPFTEFSGDELGKGKTLREKAVQADKVLRELQGKPLYNKDTGNSFIISSKGRKKMGDNANLGEVEHIAVSRLEILVERAVLVETHSDGKHINPNVRKVMRLYSPMTVSGKNYGIKLTVKDYLLEDGSERMNLHAIEAYEIKNAPMGTLRTPTQGKGYAQPASVRKISITDLLELIKD